MPAPASNPASISIGELLTREHREIDAGIEAFVARARNGAEDATGNWVAPLLDAMTALRRHIYLEEAFLFPPIRAAGLMMPIMVMLREHGELWRAMDQLGEALESGTGDSCLRHNLVTRCGTMLELLEAHNSKEEPIIYSRADVDLSEAAHAELARFLRTGSTPPGWVCERAAG
ncbi:hemerythrin domain-containing protein [Ruania zhangjianzhongii]|uniref:hemerythrin domain-containing protein n=1 Tax=Ruania zhangjianzhongii TaxID=2603206 RepID=UPI0011CAB407|nr:hemerythrin domain-containing protein [Ruania zhangjianzhongii]